MDEVCRALQDILDREGEGWSVAHYVAVVGIQRVGSDDVLESSVYHWAPKGQPDYISDALLCSEDTSRVDYD